MEKICQIFAKIRSLFLHNNLIFIAVFITLLMIPLYTMPTNIKDFERSFMGREFLLRGWGDLRSKIFGDRIFKGLIIGKNGWLVYTGDYGIDDYQRKFQLSENDLQRLIQKYDGIDKELKENGIDFLIVVAPNKNTIYPEFMPTEVPVIGEQTIMDQMISYQKKNGKVKILDLRPALLKEKEERQVYYATDTHWNPYGAWVAYQEIINALKIWYPVLEPHRIDEFRFVSMGKKMGDLALDLGQINMTEEYFRLEPIFDSRVKAWTTKCFEGEGMRTIRVPDLTQITPPQDVGSTLVTIVPDPTFPRMIMYRDSFSTYLIPFLSHHFSQGLYWSTNHIDINLVIAERPDIVILEITERHLMYLLNEI